MNWMKKRVLAVATAVLMLPIPVVSAAEDAPVWLVMEAEAVSVNAPVTIQTDGAASGGKFISAPGSGSIGEADGSDSAVYPFAVPARDAYSIWVRAKAPHNYADSLFFSLDNGGEAFELLTVSPLSTEWTWYNLKTRVLSEGEHRFTVRYRERDFAMDQFVVTNAWKQVPRGVGTLLEAAEETPEITYDAEKLQSMAGVHPRLFVDDARVAEIKSRIAADSRYASMWREVKAVADANAAASPPDYVLSESTDDGWQRSVAYKTANLAAAYLFSGDAKYSAAAQKWALASCSYPTWGRGHYEGIDLAASHQLFSLSLVYDWCYDALDGNARDVIETALLERGKQMYVSVRAPWRTYWMSQMLQNHFMIGLNGLGTAGLAVFDAEPAALEWVAEAVNGYRATFETLGHDGASLEGFGYWTYGLESLLGFADNARQLTGVDFFGSDWLRNTANYAAALTLPEQSWSAKGSHVDIADSDRGNAQFTGPDYQLRKLAGEYGLGSAQTLANKLDDQNLTYPNNNWYNLIWYDPAVEETPLSGQGTFSYFDDLGIVSARSGYDGAESQLVYKNGPYVGRKAIEMRAGQNLPDWGAGHAHPDANSFVLFGNGDWLLRDDGYSPKYTQNHNTLLIGGKGQLGEGGTWMNYAEADKASPAPAIQTAYDSETLSYMAGDAAGAYAPDSGLVQYRRHLAYVKPSTLLVIDEVETSRAQEVELRFFPESQTFAQAGGVLTFTGDNSRLAAANLSGGGSFRAEDVAIKTGRSGADETRKAIRTTKTVDGEWVNVTAFSWSDENSAPATPTLFAAQDGVYRFSAGGREIAVDTANLCAYEEAPEARVVYHRLLAEGRQTDPSSLQAGDTVSAEAYVAKEAGAEASAALLFALKQNGELIHLVAAPGRLAASETGKRLATEAITLPREYDNTWKLEIYVWDSLTGLAPVPRMP